MNSISINQNDLSQEIDYAKNLYNNKYLQGPEISTCDSNTFKIYKDLQYKINKMSFRCSNNKCWKKYKITINSFYNKFAHQNLKLISEM